MRVAVVSDTHHQLSLARDALSRVGRVQLLVHAGDFAGDAVALGVEKGLPVWAVCGNGDWWEQVPFEEVRFLEGQPVLLTHGHRYGVKGSLVSLRERAAELGVRVVIYGHTHVAEIREERGILFLNPGSPSRPRYGRGTCAVLELTPQGVDAHLIEVQK